MAKYQSKCGLVVEIPEGTKKHEKLALKSDAPFPGYDKPVSPPEECDEKCLMRRKPAFSHYPSSDRRLVTVRTWNCTFAKVQD
jgi:hypothetical protein